MLSSGDGAERVIFVRGGGLGDFILSLPVLRALSTRHSWICLVTRRRYLDLVPPSCRYDMFLDCDSVAATQLYAPTQQDGASTPDMKALCSGASLYLFARHDPHWASGLDAFAFERVYWLDPRPSSPPHVVEQFFLQAGLQPVDPARVASLWPERPSGEQLWVHPGSGSPLKNAPLDTFATVAERWCAANGGGVIASFGEADEALIGPFVAAMRERSLPYRCVQPGGLRELQEHLLREAKIYIGNDSGVSHLAAALGIPTVAIFQATDPAIWHPLGRRVTVATAASVVDTPF